jgi:hypothetical protein
MRCEIVYNFIITVGIGSGVKVYNFIFGGSQNDNNRLRLSALESIQLYCVSTGGLKKANDEFRLLAPESI